MSTIRCITILLAIVLPTGIQGKEAAAKLDDLTDDLARIVKETGMPSIAAAAIVNGEIRAAGATGVRKRGEATAVTLRDKYHLGSCTKSMTATLAAILVEEGKVKWTTKVGDVIKEKWVHENFRNATLLQLLSNTGGCPGDVEPTLWEKLFVSTDPPKTQRAELAKGILSKKPTYPPGEDYQYSNAGFSIAGIMLERKAGKPWETLILEKLLKPLGMASAGFRAPASKDRVDQPWGHNPKPVPPVPFGDNPHAIGPAGTVHCSILDWAKYAKFHLQAKPGAILKTPKSFVRLHSVQSKKAQYGLGWGVIDVKSLNGKVLQHSGSNTMWFATIWVVPGKNFAGVVCTNSGEQDAEGACHRVLEMMLDRYVPNEGK